MKIQRHRNDATKLKWEKSNVPKLHHVTKGNCVNWLFHLGNIQRYFAPLSNLQQVFPSETSTFPLNSLHCLANQNKTTIYF